LNWAAQGKSFFDDWDFLTGDANNGASQYLDKGTAIQEQVAQAADTHAILRVGSKGNWLKRKSAKIATQKSWTTFLATMRFSHTPTGCGVWPSFWTNAKGVEWPNGGELDVMEYVNDFPSQSSFHTGKENKCKLNAALLNKPGCAALPDTNKMGYECSTSYPEKLGCAPNKYPLRTGQQISGNPGVYAVEHTQSYMKVFFIPETEMPADMNSNEPKPDTWDQWVISYYPFASSDQSSPGSCPSPMQAQQLILNIGMCGDWAGKVWPLGSCVNKGHGTGMGPIWNPESTGQCIADKYNPAHDCCTQFMWDQDGTYGTDAYLAQSAYFNISSIKVYTPAREELIV
jgi:hypothetical protein